MNMIIRRQFLAPSTACGFASVVAPLIAADPADAGVRAGEQVELATRNDSVWGHPTHFPGRSKLNRPGFAGGSNFQIGWSHDEQNDEQVFP
jgi:hypothetical protein